MGYTQRPQGGAAFGIGRIQTRKKFFGGLAACVLCVRREGLIYALCDVDERI
jgi:hypothetical protein